MTAPHPATVPDLTVITPVFNRPTRVGEAVASVLAQDLPAGCTLELIVVDDGSTDDGATAHACAALAAAHPEVRVLSFPDNRGPSAARNLALAEAGAPLVTFLDSDDLMVPGRLRFQLERLAADPPCDGVTGTERIEVQPGVDAPTWVKGLPPETIARRQYLMSLLIPKAALDAIGGFDESVRIGEDTDLVVRLQGAGVRLAHEDRHVIVRRIFGDNLIYDDDGVRRAMLGAVRRHAARTRPSAGSDGRTPDGRG